MVRLIDQNQLKPARMELLQPILRHQAFYRCNSDIGYPGRFTIAHFNLDASLGVGKTAVLRRLLHEFPPVHDDERPVAALPTWEDPPDKLRENNLCVVQKAQPVSRRGPFPNATDAKLTVFPEPVARETPNRF